MQSIVSKGKDVKEAIRLGLDLLNVKMDDVHIEIIQQESKGFLGIGGKSAVVKLSKEQRLSDEKTTSIESFEQMVDGIDESETGSEISVIHVEDGTESASNKPISGEGKAWVKDGRLYCQASPTQYPTVAFNKDIQLLKNNMMVQTSPMIISEKDQVEIKPVSKREATKWKVTMSSDKLQVTLRVEPGFEVTRKVLDTEASSHIVLETTEHKEVLNTLTYEEVILEMQKLHVIQGFNQKEIMNALNAKEPGTFEIAFGVPPKPGKDGWIERLVETDTKQGLKEDGNGNVDFREIRTIPTVNSGMVIAVIHPPIPGQTGVTVTNEPLPAKQTSPVQLKLGKGVMTVDDKIVATESGRPKIEQRGKLVKVSIMPKLIHRGDVDLESGNIRFTGDVEVMGDIKEGMTVEAKGDLIVHGTVNFAALTTSGAIITKGNVIGSELSAGKNNMLVAELGHMLGILHKQVEQMGSFIKQLTLSSAFKQADLSSKGLQPLIKILLEKKFKSFTSIAKRYMEVAQRGEEYLDQPEWIEIALVMNQIYLTMSKQVISYKIIDDLSLKMKKMHEWSKTPVDPDAYITLSSVLNSQLYSSGDITIIGKGCINSKIHAGGCLKISGIVRGGELYAKNGIEINEAGAESGTSTFISVPLDQTIRIKKAMEGTIIKIGNIKYVFKETTNGVHARLVNDDQLIIH